MMHKRAAVFVLLIAVSVWLFPLSAFGLAGIPFLGDFLFFWPQFMLVPYGFVNREVGYSQSFFMDSAIYGAIAFWLICAWVFGYVLRNVKMRYVVLATYPVAVATMFVCYLVLHQFGYSVYLEGP